MITYHNTDERNSYVPSSIVEQIALQLNVEISLKVRIHQLKPTMQSAFFPQLLKPRSQNHVERQTLTS